MAPKQCESLFSLCTWKLSEYRKGKKRSNSCYTRCSHCPLVKHVRTFGYRAICSYLTWVGFRVHQPAPYSTLISCKRPCEWENVIRVSIYRNMVCRVCDVRWMWCLFVQTNHQFLILQTICWWWITTQFQSDNGTERLFIWNDIFD